ncbi:MAG: D-alanyl-D-alanine carboxypeptidase family protein [Actinomycetota bacterium]
MPGSARLRRPKVFVSTIVIVFAGTASLAAAQQTPDELREERRGVQEEQANLEILVNALDADVDVLAEELRKLQESIDAQQAALEAAERKVADAEAEERAAEQRIADIEAELAATEQLLRDTAVDAFVGLGGPRSDNAALDANPWQYVRTESLIEFGTGNTAEIIDDMRALSARLEAERVEAADTTADLVAQRTVVEQRKRDLDAAFLEEDEALRAVEDRLDARLAEVAALEELDAELAAEIKAEEQRIADAIARRNRDRSVTIPDNAPVELANVGGIVVNVLIADQVEGLLAAVEARGYPLSGGGYRSSENQIRLRRAHCGTSDYAIWEMPAYQCRPPTARPGRSQHELGLAIDFTYQGSIIRSRSSTVFQVLSEVAPQYGMFNLPSEPWHWSTTGG